MGKEISRIRLNRLYSENNIFEADRLRHSPQASPPCRCAGRESCGSVRRKYR